MKRILVRLGLLVLALTVSVSAFAKSKSENITLYHDASLNGANLPAGDYVVKYDVDGTNAQVKFLRGSKEVASANGQVKTLSQKADSNQVVVNVDGNARSVKEIDFGGKVTAITFESATTTAGR
jgi:hypothetical protein